MKVTRTSVHRLTITKGCGCQATREYEDIRYTKPVSIEAVFVACEKHDKNKAFAEFAGEMLIEALDKEAETAGKAPQLRDAIPTTLQGTSGESVQSMGIAPKIREKRDPLAPKLAQINRPDARKLSNTQFTNLNTAEAVSDEDSGFDQLTMDGDIEGVPADPRVEAALKTEFDNMTNLLDDEEEE